MRTACARKARDPGGSNPGDRGRQPGGFSGIGPAVNLRRAGVEDFAVVERGDGVGGTWHSSTYPGCACDVPSNLYSFSFAPNPDWSRTYSRQPEIRSYLERVVDRFGVRSKIQLNTEVLEAAWDEEAKRWRIDTSAGPVTAKVLISGTGASVIQYVPKIAPDVERLHVFQRTPHNPTLWPDWTWRFRRRTARFDPAEYVIV
jgi:cation diffusion facilitator CzcD-associated flavoprotein CzcO